MTPIDRALRTVLQFIAAGGLTAFVNEVVAELNDARLTALVLAVATLAVSYAQNEAEERGFLPPLLKS